MLTYWLMVINNPAVAVGVAERTQVARLKRFDAIGGVFGDVAAVEDRIVHDQQTAAALGVRIGGDFDRIDQIQISVGADRRRRPHGTDYDDRFVGLERQVKKVSCLLNGICSMGDNDAIGFVLVKNSVNRAHQIE